MAAVDLSLWAGYRGGGGTLAWVVPSLAAIVVPLFVLWYQQTGKKEAAPRILPGIPLTEPAVEHESFSRFESDSVPTIHSDDGSLGKSVSSDFRVAGSPEFSELVGMLAVRIIDVNEIRALACRSGLNMSKLSHSKTSMGQWTQVLTQARRENVDSRVLAETLDATSNDQQLRGMIKRWRDSR